VTYSDNKSYFFAPPPLTAGSEDDLIVMPNLPLMGALRRLAGSSLATAGLEAMLGSYSFGIDKHPFVKLTVREFLWGYPSLIMSIDQFQVSEPQRTYIPRVSQCLSPRWNWPPHPLSRKRWCPPNQRGGGGGGLRRYTFACV
jgi:hypothetical protein